MLLWCFGPAASGLRRAYFCGLNINFPPYRRISKSLSVRIIRSRRWARTHGRACWRPARAEGIKVRLEGEPSGVDVVCGRCRLGTAFTQGDAGVGRGRDGESGVGALFSVSKRLRAIDKGCDGCDRDRGSFTHGCGRAPGWRRGEVNRDRNIDPKQPPGRGSSLTIVEVSEIRPGNWA